MAAKYRTDLKAFWSGASSRDKGGLCGKLVSEILHYQAGFKPGGSLLPTKI